jgi:hypothetical protein
MFVDMGKSMAPIGGYQETAVIPDEVGVLDGGDVVEGLGVDAWRRVVECVGF